MTKYDGLYERLDDWFDMFKETKSLNIHEAKELAKKINASSSEKEKGVLREKLMYGTIGEVYKFIKNNGMLMLCDAGYVDFDDLVNSLAFSWVDGLEKRILEVGRYSTLFSRDYFESVADMLGVTNLSEELKIRNSGYLGALGSYYRDKDNEVELSPYFDYTFATGFECTEENKKKTIDIIEKGYQLYKENSFINSDNTALLGFYGMIFTSAIVSEGKYGREDNFEFSDEAIIRMDIDKLVFHCSSLTERQREVIAQRFGFDGYGEKDLEFIGKNIGLCKSRVSQHLVKGLKSLRKSRISKYN